MAGTPAGRCLTDSELRKLYAQTMDASTARGAQSHLAECSSCWQRYAAIDPDATSVDTQTATSSVMQSSSHFFGRPPQLEGYEILQELGRGGQAVVYQALQISTRRTVAIKVAPRRILDHAAERSRFQREIEVLAQLNHPGIVTIHVSGESDHLCYFVMDYVSGVPLDEFARRTEHSVNDRIRLFIKVCDAVNAAHLLGIVHRDIKPGNILVDEQNEPHLLDFGLAKLTLGSRDPAEMTLTGDFLGTPKWTSPEQAERHPGKVDLRTDVYSLGVVLYQLLTGDFPYGLDGSLSQVEHNIIHAEPERPSRKNRRLDDELDRIVLKCLRKDRDGRYANAGELASDLRRYLAGEPVLAKSPSLVYLVRTRTRKAVARAPLVTGVFMVVASAIIGNTVAYVVQSTRVGGVIERAMTAAAGPSLAGQPFEHVRLIALGDDADVASLARAEGLSNVSPREPRSLRRLHGRLMEKLVHSDCRAVVWDIAFPGESAHDEAFLKGVRALKGAGIDVVVGTHTWWHGVGMPDLSPVLAPEVSWGCMAAGLSEKADWRLQLVARRGRTDPRPSLALAGLAAFRQPGARYDIELDLYEESAELVYWRPNDAMPNTKRWLGATDRVLLTALRMGKDSGDDMTAAFAQFGLGEGDALGTFLVNIPTNEALASLTHNYPDVLPADATQLSEWFAGNAIIIADIRTGADPRRKHPDGRLLPACYSHVAGLNDLLLQVSVRRPRVVGEWTIPLGGAAVGAAIALGITADWRRRLVGLAAAVAAILLTLLAYHSFGYLCDPVLPVGALLAAYLLCGTIPGVRAAHRI